ncbi:MAG: hypothetical protein WBP16_17090 [Ferruginibacter sp.]
MKKLKILLVIIFLGFQLYAQEVNNNVTLKDLAVPNSPAFIVADITPSLIQTPNTPKAFVFGLAQSYQQSSDGFPQNYSVEFAPYWWLKPKNRNVYTLLGFKTKTDERKTVTEINGINPFSGLKFTSISMAFLKKDLIPDSNAIAQKIFSVGLRTTVVKIYMKSHYENLKKKIGEWHETAQKELSIIMAPIDAISRDTTLSFEQKINKKAELLQKVADLKTTGTAEQLKKINDIINQRPIFSMDIAAAYAIYGVGDTSWRSGRSGIWTTLSSYIPLKIGDKEINRNYFNLNFSVRYLFDNYSRTAKGIIEKNNSIDVGGKIALEFGQFNFGVESLYRFNNGVSASDNRTLGMVNFKIKDNLYIQGAFGKNFNVADKLIALFGINWGFGNETVNLPDTK